MSTHLQSKPNPFSTRFVRPGAIIYQRHDARSLDEWVDEFFDRYHGQASIIGPHGSGKSTLIASLKTCFAERAEVFAYRLSSTDRNFTSIWSDRRRWQQKSLVIVDGYEQLSVWSQWRLKVSVRYSKASFLITAHQAFRGIPVLWKTAIDEGLALKLRDSLLASHPEFLSSEELEDAWRDVRKAFPTDMRETWMSMYDWAEVQKQKRLASHDNSRAV